VFAVPGNITSRNSFGTNYLIKGAGAKLVQQWQDIATELPPQIAAKLLPPPFGEKKEKSLPDKLSFVPSGLSREETSVFRLLTPDSPTHIDLLIDKSKLEMSDLTSALLSLEMKELIRALPGRCFVRRLWRHCRFPLPIADWLKSETKIAVLISRNVTLLSKVTPSLRKSAIGNWKSAMVLSAIGNRKWPYGKEFSNRRIAG